MLYLLGTLALIALTRTGFHAPEVAFSSRYMFYHSTFILLFLLYFFLKSKQLSIKPMYALMLIAFMGVCVHFLTYNVRIGILKGKKNYLKASVKSYAGGGLINDLTYPVPLHGTKKLDYLVASGLYKLPVRQSVAEKLPNYPLIDPKNWVHLVQYQDEVYLTGWLWWEERPEEPYTTDIHFFNADTMVTYQVEARNSPGVTRQFKNIYNLDHSGLKGTFDMRTLPPGTYRWILTITYSDGSKFLVNTHQNIRLADFEGYEVCEENNNLLKNIDRKKGVVELKERPDALGAQFVLLNPIKEANGKTNTEKMVLMVEGTEFEEITKYALPKGLYAVQLFSVKDGVKCRTTIGTYNH
jgi:hypothetical protein